LHDLPGDASRFFRSQVFNLCRCVNGQTDEDLPESGVPLWFAHHDKCIRNSRLFATLWAMNKQQRDEAIFRAGNHLSAALGELKAAQAALKAAGVSETRPSRLMNTFFAVALLRDLLKEELHRHLYGI